MPLPFTKLYGKTSANLYSKAFSQHMQAKKAFESAADTYFMANDAASYDDWKRARAHWNYFCMFPPFYLRWVSCGSLFYRCVCLLLCSCTLSCAQILVFALFCFLGVIHLLVVCRDISHQHRFSSSFPKFLLPPIVEH